MHHGKDQIWPRLWQGLVMAWRPIICRYCCWARTGWSGMSRWRMICIASLRIYILPSSGNVKKPGSSIEKFQSINWFWTPNIPKAGLIVDAGGYLPFNALLKKGFFGSWINALNWLFEIPFDKSLIEYEGELNKVTILPLSQRGF